MFSVQYQKRHKKGDVGQKAPGLPHRNKTNKGSSSSPKISVTIFLDIVKDFYSGILSNNVLAHFKIARDMNDVLSPNVKYSKDFSGVSELFDDDRTMTEEQIKQEIYNQL